MIAEICLKHAEDSVVLTLIVMDLQALFQSEQDQRVRHIIRYGRAGENLQSHIRRNTVLSSNYFSLPSLPFAVGGERQIEQLSCKTASNVSVGRASDRDAMIIDVAVHALKSWDGQVALAEEVSILHGSQTFQGN
jgi:hypothetical protein